MGVRAQKLQQVLVFRNAPGHSDQETTIFMATGLSPITQRSSTSSPEEHDMQVVWVAPEDAVQLLGQYGPPDAKSLTWT